MNGEYCHDDLIGSFDSGDADSDEWLPEDEAEQDRELYDSHIDNLDEVIVLRDQFN
eukprot:CAMPEP_0176339530 /NCGR_PEP_ID=MMETSP0126-20121128/831_1 /TAXON_ID=141414 ORGANISM="Strombidinopsis acuminatum, Strain SPMC142" /NCGR_SAMPLE_ID=MMETSP0126 /ASSEMBLY_ACC=CAM_ASM_000229 /LENGTH=55 /DNA_ID=CAMNT_0017683161 /DNA_START=1955 /DNA_END=2122 /DNA_ORIENTATION=-